MSRRYVLLLDPILASGASCISAIDLLLSKGVAEDRIIFLTLIAAPQGIQAVCERYKRLVVVTSEIDLTLSPTHVVLPGMGEFGDRYFGTDCVSADREGDRDLGGITPCVDDASHRAQRARLSARASAGDPAPAAARELLGERDARVTA